MSFIETHALAHNTIQSVHSEWESIVPDPEYQRNGDIWSLEKKQLLIDSIINRYDLPKIYFHKFDRDLARKKGKSYAIIDGRQRLEAIIGFINNDFKLSGDFEFLADPTVKASGMTYNDLAKKYPKIKSRFDSTSLPIMTVETDDLDLIDDMFSRLNEAVPLNAPEKRRAIGGDMVRAIDQVSSHGFFKRVRFSNKRYQHKEVAVRLLFLQHHDEKGKIVDTKKPFLDDFAREFRDGRRREVAALKSGVVDLLDALEPVFTNKDPLLQAQAAVPVYVLVYKQLKSKAATLFTRVNLNAFNDERAKNREMAEKDIRQATFELLEFDRLSQQGTNDASSIRQRLAILQEWLRARGK